MAHEIKLRILQWGDYPGLSGCVQCNHKDPYKGEANGSKAGKGAVRTVAEGGVMHFKDEGKGHKPKNSQSL